MDLFRYLDTQGTVSLVSQKAGISKLSLSSSKQNYAEMVYFSKVISSHIDQKGEASWRRNLTSYWKPPFDNQSKVMLTFIGKFRLTYIIKEKAERLTKGVDQHVVVHIANRFGYKLKIDGCKLWKRFWRNDWRYQAKRIYLAEWREFLQ